MGQISRINRASRFIDEFDKDAEEASGFNLGDRLTIKKIYLDARESDESVMTYYLCLDRQGNEITLTDGVVLFDPEYDTGDDVVERVSSWLSQDADNAKEEILARLEKTDLI